jgi:hypothetical protein
VTEPVKTAIIHCRVTPMNGKGKISPNLERILRDEEGRTSLRRLLINGRDGEITIGNTKYYVSTKAIHRSKRGGPSKTTLLASRG